ncbi:MAG: DUF6695 family protein [bacterium]
MKKNNIKNKKNINNISNNDKDGFAVALAWPKTYCRAANSWYDSLLNLLNISENNYYRVGHAAVVLINLKGECFYYDFGRYTAPYGHGRVRSSKTDHDLKLSTIIKFNKNKILNFDDLLIELQNKEACHGEGELHASYCKINFNSANNLAKKMNDLPYIRYGPFVFNGTNCSRFVRTIILAGKPSLKHYLKLLFFVPFTPTPLNNVNNLTNKKISPFLLKIKLFDPYLISKKDLKTILPAPKMPKNLSNAIWLGGEGCGTWFDIKFDHQSDNGSEYIKINAKIKKIPVVIAFIKYLIFFYPIVFSLFFRIFLFPVHKAIIKGMIPIQEL